MLDEKARESQAACISYRFGRFVLRGRERMVLADDQPVELGSRAFDVLLMLAETAGDLVMKRAILDRAWFGVAVEENNLQVQISTLRRILGPDRDWIVTVPGHGYRFTAPVTILSGAGEPAVARAAAARRKAPRLSILILPVADHTCDPALAWFAEAMTDSLTTDLARALPSCTVVTHTPAGAEKVQAVDMHEVARAHCVRYALKVSMLPTDDRIRVNAQLIDVESSACVWAERFDKHRLGVLQVQDEIVGRLSRSARLQMIACEARRAEQDDHDQPDTCTAADFVLRGDAAANQHMRTRHGFDAASTFYESAWKLEPGNADALAGMANVRVSQVLNSYLDAGWTPSHIQASLTQARTAHLAEAEEKLTRALAAVPGHYEALRARALLLRARGAFAEALVAAETLLAHNPSEPMGYREVGLNLLYLGRTEEAVEWFGRADALMPSDPIRWTWLQGLGRALIHLGRNREAADALRLAIESNPSHAFFHALLGAALALAGDDEWARVEMARFLAAEPAMPPGVTMDVLAQRCAVPFEATSPLYRSRNERLLDGLRRASLA